MNQMTVYNAGLAVEDALGDSLVALQSGPGGGDEIVLTGAVDLKDTVVVDMLNSTFAARGFTVVDVTTTNHNREFTARVREKIRDQRRTAMLDG